MGKIHDVLSKIKSPEARAAMAARFGVTLSASLDPPRRGTAPGGMKGDGEINNEETLLREVAKAREALGLPPQDKPADGDDVPAGFIDGEASLEREVKKARRSLGLSV